MKESIKTKIISLVNRSSDKQFLLQLYNVLESRTNFEEGQLFDQLSAAEKEDTLLSYQESQEPNELIDHDQLMKESRKAFGWD